MLESCFPLLELFILLPLFLSCNEKHEHDRTYVARCIINCVWEYVMTYTDINNKEKKCVFLCFVLYLAVNIYLIKIKTFYQLTREKFGFLAMRASFWCARHVMTGTYWGQYQFRSAERRCGLRALPEFWWILISKTGPTAIFLYVTLRIDTAKSRCFGQTCYS